MLHDTRHGEELHVTADWLVARCDASVVGIAFISEKQKYASHVNQGTSPLSLLRRRNEGKHDARPRYLFF